MLDWLLPPRCLACGCASERSGALCAECWAEADFIAEPYCACCGLPFELPSRAGSVCGACLRSPLVFDRARAVMAYDDLSRRMILGLKYADRLDMDRPSPNGWSAPAATSYRTPTGSRRCRCIGRGC